MKTTAKLITGRKNKINDNSPRPINPVTETSLKEYFLNNFAAKIKASGIVMYMPSANTAGDSSLPDC